MSSNDPLPPPSCIQPGSDPYFGTLCDYHWQVALDGAEVLKVRFELMLRRGVHRKIANARLIAEMEKEDV